MIELVVIALLAFIAWQDWQRREERQAFFDYVMAKDAFELKELREKPKKTKSKPVEPDIRMLDQLSDEEFDKAIKKELGREGFVEKAKESLVNKVKHGR